MSAVNDMIKDIPLPNMVKIRQEFDSTQIDDVEEEVKRILNTEKICGRIRKGMSVAVAVGSRGISNHALIVKTTIDFLKDQGAMPFLVSAMGSHGGNSIEGQKEILTGYGITEEYCGCPVKVGSKSVRIGVTEDGRPVYIDKYASEADGIVLINRIKPHTAFRGRY